MWKRAHRLHWRRLARCRLTGCARCRQPGAFSISRGSQHGIADGHGPRRPACPGRPCTAGWRAWGGWRCRGRCGIGCGGPGCRRGRAGRPPCSRQPDLVPNCANTLRKLHRVLLHYVLQQLDLTGQLIQAALHPGHLSLRLRRAVGLRHVPHLMPVPSPGSEAGWHLRDLRHGRRRPPGGLRGAWPRGAAPQLLQQGLVLRQSNLPQGLKLHALRLVGCSRATSSLPRRAGRPRGCSTCNCIGDVGHGCTWWAPRLRRSRSRCRTWHCHGWPWDLRCGWHCGCQ